MSLAPSVTVTLGSLQYDAHVAGLRVDLRTLPGLDAGVVTLPAGARLDAGPGDTATLELDGGEGAATVLTGTVRAVRTGERCHRVTVADGSAELAALRPAATYERQDAKAVIRALASDAGADVGRLDVDLDLAAYVADQRRTAAEHIAGLAALAGAVASFDGDGVLGVAPAASAPALALRHGRELLHCEVGDRPRATAPLVPVGFGPAGSAQAPGALRHTTEVLPAAAAAAGAGALRLPVAVLRTPASATAAGRAAAALGAAEGRRLRARAFLLPALRPGLVVDVQDLPEHMQGGPWLVTAVIHELAPGSGATTWFEARAAGGGGAEGLLAAAAGAIGGLL